MSRKFFTIFEHHQQPLVSKSVFLRRVARCAWVAFLLLAVSISTLIHRFLHEFHLEIGRTGENE